MDQFNHLTRADLDLPDAELVNKARCVRPTSWADMGSSERDLWEERQARSIRRFAKPTH